MQNYAKIPDAVALIQGSGRAPRLSGYVRFYQEAGSVLVVANIRGLPQSSKTGFFGFHIHQGTDCSGMDFSETGGHYNPLLTAHPMHPGDLPPLLMYGNRAYLAVRTNRFQVSDIIGRTVVIHSDPDDFYSQPAGNAGTKIACGIIRRKRR